MTTYIALAITHANTHTCTHTCTRKKGWISNEYTAIWWNITRRAYMDFDRAILFRINYLISQEIKVNIIYPVKSLCVFWLSSCSVWWQATLETNYHVVVAQHKTSVWMNECECSCVFVANIKFCCDASNSLHFEFRSKLFDVICKM